MSAMIKCPNCGAAIQDDSIYCRYCGGKLPDDVKQIEVKIDNIAEIVRAQYETEESKERLNHMKWDLRMRKFKFWLFTIWIGVGVILSFPRIIGLENSDEPIVSAGTTILLTGVSFGYLAYCFGRSRKK